MKNSSRVSVGFVHSLKGKMNIVVSFMLMLFVGTVFFSCDKDDILSHPTTEQSDLNQSTSLTMTRAPSTITYHSAPGIGGFSPNSSSDVTLGQDTRYHGGVIKAQVVKQRNHIFVIRITKQDGSCFSGKGIAFVKVGSVDGSIAGRVICEKGANYVYIPVQATFDQGYVHFYPVFYSTQSKAYYYAEPILVYTLPLYNSHFVLGKTLGTANGVKVICNGVGNIDEYNDYQCV